jgi:hypothetical protein
MAVTAFDIRIGDREMKGVPEDCFAGPRSIGIPHSEGSKFGVYGMKHLSTTAGGSSGEDMGGSMSLWVGSKS